MFTWAACAIAAALALLASASYADAQGLYLLNGRATPSVIIGADGRAWPVVPGPQYAGPSPLILAPPHPAPPYGPPIDGYAPPAYAPPVAAGMIAAAAGRRRR